MICTWYYIYIITISIKYNKSSISYYKIELISFNKIALFCNALIGCLWRSRSIKNTWIMQRSVLFLKLVMLHAYIFKKNIVSFDVGWIRLSNHGTSAVTFRSFYWRHSSSSWFLSFMTSWFFLWLIVYYYSFNLSILAI